MKTALPTPTEELVRTACKEFDQDNLIIEQSLEELFSQYPRNSDIRHVLLKVVALNSLYSTRILAFAEKIPNVLDVARHIQQNGEYIDSGLTAGSPAIVDRIAKVAVSEKKDRSYFSFATKYCSWHKPKDYPIYDTNVEACLWYYRKQDGFATYRREGYSYAEFVRIVEAFRDFPLYDLGSVSFKEIDKFLFLYGGKLSAVKTTPIQTEPLPSPGLNA